MNDIELEVAVIVVLLSITWVQSALPLPVTRVSDIVTPGRLKSG